MSQYPPNYQPPPYPPGPYPMDFNFYAPAPDLLAPARRAAIVMWVIGGLSLLCGMCMGLALVLPTEQIMAQMGNNVPPGMTPEQIIHQATIATFILVVMSLLLIVLGFFVRRGGQGALITSTVFCGIIIVLMGINMIAAVPAVGRNPMAMMSICFFMIPLGLLILTIVWLSQGLRVGPQLRERQQQMQAQMWQYQQQAAYGSYGQPAAGPSAQYGYGFPPAAGGYPAATGPVADQSGSQSLPPSPQPSSQPPNYSPPGDSNGPSPQG